MHLGEDMAKETEQGQKPSGNFLGDMFGVLIWVVVAVIILRFFVFQPFRIPSQSMVPTLEDGDYVFVTPYSYGYGAKSFSLPILGDLPVTDVINALMGRTAEQRVFGKLPERGDIVVFRSPLPQFPNRSVIKRVVGLPGDVVEIIDGVLHVNGEAAAYSNCRKGFSNSSPLLGLEAGETNQAGQSRREFDANLCQDPSYSTVGRTFKTKVLFAQNITQTEQVLRALTAEFELANVNQVEINTSDWSYCGLQMYRVNQYRANSDLNCLVADVEVADTLEFTQLGSRLSELRTLSGIVNIAVDTRMENISNVFMEETLPAEDGQPVRTYSIAEIEDQPYDHFSNDVEVAFEARVGHSLLPRRVEPGFLFMLGDNRDESGDSRTPLLGQVPMSHVIGKGQFTLFSLNMPLFKQLELGKVETWPEVLQPWNWFRWDRFGRKLI